MSERLTRREMKRDEVQEWMGLAYFWLSDHWRKVLWGVAGVVGLGLVAVLVMVFLQHRGEQAQASLNRALKVYEAPLNVLSPSPDDPDSPSFASEAERSERARELFGDVRDRYRSTSAGRIALVYLGRIASADGDLDSARELWTEFLDKGGENALAASVQLGLYSLDREQGRFEEVVASLRAAVDSPDGRIPVDVLLHELGITLEGAGERDEALEVFQRLVDEYPASPYSAPARQRVGASGGFENIQIGT